MDGGVALAAGAAGELSSPGTADSPYTPGTADNLGRPVWGTGTDEEACPWGRILAGILRGSNSILGIGGGETDAGGGTRPAIRIPMVGSVGRVVRCGSNGSDGREGSEGSEVASSSSSCRGRRPSHSGRAFGSKSNAIELISPFRFSLVASGLRILQDFAGICRAILLKFFRVSTGWATHNP